MFGMMFAVVISASGDQPKQLQPPEQVRGVANPAFVTPLHELRYLKKNRPSLDGAGTAVGVSGLVSAVGVAFVLLSFVLVDPRGGIRSEGQVFGLMIGGAVFGLGALVGIGGGIAMGVIGAELTRVDARIRELEAQLAPPRSVRIPIIPPVVLARF